MEKIYVEGIELSKEMLQVLTHWQQDYGNVIISELSQLQDFVLENWEVFYDDSKVKKYLQLIHDLKVDIGKFVIK